MTVEVCDKMVWKPGEPHVSVAEGFPLSILPVVRMLDILTLPPIELTERLLISADLATKVDTVRVEGSRKLGGGYVTPLIDETVRAGVETQLLPVTKLVLTALEATRVLKLPDRPNTC